MEEEEYMEEDMEEEENPKEKDDRVLHSPQLGQSICDMKMLCGYYMRKQQQENQ